MGNTYLDSHIITELQYFIKFSGLNQCKLLDGGSVFFKGSTCLVEACLNRDMGMIDLLLKYGARDDECKVRIHFTNLIEFFSSIY